MVRNSGAELELPVAGWNRGLSFDQMQAVDELREALDFDINVTRDCLLRLGVRPLVGNKQLLRIVQLSRGQSLAFLYFLFQEHYSSGKSCGKYTVNGQLLLSAIAYLDLPATIRALDEVLPLRGNRVSESNTPLEVQKKHSARQSVFGVESEKPSIAMPATLQVEDKVFSSKVTQTRTRSSGQPVRSAQPYFQKQPRPKSCYRSTRFLANYPHFQVQIPNEVGDAKDDDDRWFANYQFHPIQRTVKAFISHELCHLFDQIDDSLSNPDQEPRDLCEYHKGTRSQKRLSFLNEQRRRYLKMLDVEGNEKRLNRERIIHHLNRDVDEYLLKFGDKGWSPGVPAFRKTGCVACNELVHVSLETSPQVLLLEGKWGVLYDRSGPKMRLCGGEDNEKMFLKDKDPKGNEKYFAAPGGYKPYAFNYDEVFDKDSEHALGTVDVIRNSIVKTLSNGVDLSDGIDRENGLSQTIRSSHIDEAVSRCVGKIFEKSLLAAPCVVTPRGSKERLVYNRSWIDPDDVKFMDQMLSDAFKLLRQDSKLVLASLPEGHQIPELREWIRRRYGKRYGAQNHEESEKIKIRMNELSEMTKKLIPLMADVDPRIVRQNPLPFDLYKDIMEVSEKFKKSYREKVIEIVLKQTRLCWQAQHNLRSYNSSGLRRTFFSYLPSTARNRDPTFSIYLAQKNARIT